jgi:hypothetical protein
MSAFLVGAGGDGGIIMLWSSKGTEHIKDFLLRRFGIKQFDPEEVVRITTQTGGTLKGWMPFEIGEIGTRTSFGNADMTMEKAAKMGFRTPKASPIMQYDEETALYSPVSAPSAAKITADTATAVSETLYRRHNTFITIGQAA